MPAESNKSKARVLVVDDMLVNRTILSSLLSAHGIACDAAGDGGECLELCSKNRYDLILMDHRMPGLDGVDALVQLKEMFRKDAVEIPVVCHTTEAGRDNINLYKAAGFADVLIKPVQPEELTAILDKYLPGYDLKLPDTGREKDRTEHELAKLPEWLKTVPKLDLRKGIENCETADDYMDALSVFAGSISSKADDIEELAREENWSLYVIRVHSLKSMARLVGASELAEHAAELEYEGKQEHYERLKDETGSLLEQYRMFDPLLTKTGNKAKNTISDESAPAQGTRRLLYVGNDNGVVGKSIINSLENAGFHVAHAEADMTDILAHRQDGDIVVYYPEGDAGDVYTISNYLSEVSRDDRKIYILTGKAEDIGNAQRIPLAEYIRASYERPVDMNRFVQDISDYYDALHELRRRKSILVVDDDIDFLTIMEKWLRPIYKVDCARSGEDALLFLTSSEPDLILLDYEMPEMDGYEVMQRIRSDPKCGMVPIVFFTSKSERDNVVRILERKPDGYFLKSTPKTELLDFLDRFFARNYTETIP